MKLVIILLLVVGCGSKKSDGGTTDTSSTTQPGDDRFMKAVPKPVPPGPYVVAYDCFHSMEPWGKGGSVNNSSADLAKRTWTSLAYEYTGEVTPEPFQPPPPKVTAMSPAIAETLRKAIDRVLAGGPYREEYPPSEGMPCKLTITTAAGAPVFAIDKAFTEQKDAASDMVNVFLASAGR